MPLARIDLIQGKSAEYRRTVGDIVYEAMVEALKAPKDDRFQVIAEHPIGRAGRRRKLSWRSTHSRLHLYPINAQTPVEPSSKRKTSTKAVADALHARLGLRPRTCSSIS